MVLIPLGCGILLGIFFIVFSLIFPVIATVLGMLSLLFLVFLQGPYTVWNMVSVWRCGRNSKPVWKILSRIVVVLGAIGFAVTVVDTIIDATTTITRYVNPKTASMESSFPVETQPEVNPAQDMPPQAVPPVVQHTIVGDTILQIGTGYYHSQQPLSVGDKAFIEGNWEETSTFLMSALQDPDEEKGMGAAYLLLEVGEPLIPQIETVMYDMKQPPAIRLRAKWVLVYMHSDNDKTAYTNYEVK